MKRALIAGLLLLVAGLVFAEGSSGGPSLEHTFKSEHLRHGTTRIEAIAASGDGKTFATAGEGGTKVWDAATRKEVRTIADAKDGWLALSQDGKRLVSVHEDGSVRLQDARAESGPRCILVESTAVEGNAGAVAPPWARTAPAIAITRDGQHVAAMVASSLKVWSVATGDEEKSFDFKGPAYRSLAFTADGKQLGALSTRALVLHDLTTGKVKERKTQEDELADFHRPHSLAFPSGQFARWVCCFTMVELDLRDEDESPVAIFRLPFAAAVFRQQGFVTWPDGQTFAILEGSTVTIERAGGRRHLRGNAGDIAAIAPLDRTTVVSGGADGTIRLWDVESEKEIDPAPGHRGAILGVAFAGEDKVPTHVASVSADAVTGWELATKKGRPIDATRQRVTATAHVPRSSCVVLGELDGSARVVDVASGTMRGMVELESTVRAIGASADGRRLVFGLDDRSLRIFDAYDLVEVARLDGFENFFSSIASSPDGRRFAVACHSTKVRLLAPTGRIEKTLTTSAEASLVAFAPDGKSLAVAHDDFSIGIYDIESGKSVRTFEGKTSVRALAFGPDGNELLVATAMAGQEPALLRSIIIDGSAAERVLPTASPVSALATSRSVKSLACGHDDGSVSLWRWR